MKLLRILTVLLLAASLAYAQNGEDLVANVPFAFIVAGRTLPPGHYIISRLNQGDLAIQGGKNHIVLFSVHAMNRAKPEDSSRLVFHRYGDTYFLSEVWAGGNLTGKALFPSNTERAMARRRVEKEFAFVRMGK